MEQLRVTCPDCGGELLVDSRTGAVVSHRAAERPSPAKDLDALFREAEENKARAEEIFERERLAYQDRDRLLEDRFREALERAQASGDDGPPKRPWDLD